MAKSIYLSTGRFAGRDNDPADWQSELASLQRSLKSGEKIAYDEAELARIAETREAAHGAPAWNALFQFFLPGILLIAAIWLLVYLLRASRP